MCEEATFSSSNGSLFCEPVQPGYRVVFADSDAIRRVGETQCSPGTYSLGAEGCSNCADGYAAEASGAAACTICDAGTVPNTNHTQCTRCPEGRFSTTGAVECTACVAGRYQPSNSSDTCIACGAGYYQSATGSTSCEPAANGTYASATGQASASPCPAGTYSGASATTSCSACPAGGEFLTVGDYRPIYCV